MGFFKQWRERRRVYDEGQVLHALRMLRPEQASGFPIHRLAQISPGRVYVALIRLQRRGVIVGWQEPQPWCKSEFRPRRRLYRIVEEDAVSEAGR